MIHDPFHVVHGHGYMQQHWCRGPGVGASASRQCTGGCLQGTGRGHWCRVIGSARTGRSRPLTQPTQADLHIVTMSHAKGKWQHACSCRQGSHSREQLPHNLYEESLKTNPHSSMGLFNYNTSSLIYIYCSGFTQTEVQILVRIQFFIEKITLWQESRVGDSDVPMRRNSVLWCRDYSTALRILEMTAVIVTIGERLRWGCVGQRDTLEADMVSTQARYVRPKSEKVSARLSGKGISKITLSFTTLLPFWLYGTYL